MSTLLQLLQVSVYVLAIMGISVMAGFLFRTVIWFDTAQSFNTFNDAITGSFDGSKGSRNNMVTEKNNKLLSVFDVCNIIMQNVIAVVSV